MVNDYKQFFDQGSDKPILYTNGDSFTWGTGIGNLFSHPKRNFKKFNDGRLFETWPGILAKNLKWKFINDAWAGGSNKRVIRRTKKFINDIEECANVKVII